MAEEWSEPRVYPDGVRRHHVRDADEPMIYAAGETREEALAELDAAREFVRTARARTDARDWQTDEDAFNSRTAA